RKTKVLATLQSLEQVCDLKRPRQAMCADIVRTQAVQRCCIQDQVSVVCGEHTGDQIEQRGLASAVRSNQGMHAFPSDLKIHILDCHDTAESLVHTDATQSGGCLVRQKGRGEIRSEEHD